MGARHSPHGRVGNRQLREVSMKEAQILNLPQREIRVEIIEESDRVLLRVRFDKCGDFGDRESFLKSLEPLISKYEADPRPVVMDKVTGEVAAIFGDREGGVVFVTRPD